MQVLIDGKETQVEFGGYKHPNRQWVEMFVMGRTITGRLARVSCHTIPASLLDGGVCRAGGHTYEIKR